MSTTGTTLATRARFILQDTAGTRWVDAELLQWINAAQLAIVALKPSAYVTYAARSLTISTTKQTLPSGGLRLLDIIRNTSGAQVRRIDRTTLDMEVADWHDVTGAATVKHWMFDPDLPTVFWVYPPQPGSAPGSLDIIYVDTPTTLSALASNISLSDEYADAILDYVCYRAFMKDADNQASAGKAQTHYTAFVNFLTGKIQGEDYVNPNKTGKTA